MVKILSKKDLSRQDTEVESLMAELEPSPPRTQKEADILLAAERVFADRGVHQSTTAEIAKVANVTEKTLFRYFPQKDILIKRVLFSLVLRTIVPHQLKSVRAIIQENSESPESFLRTLFANRVESAKANRNQFKLFANEILANEELRKKAYGVAEKFLFSSIYQIFEKFRDQGLVRQDLDLEIMVKFVLQSLTSQILFNIILADEPKEIDIKSTLTLLLDSINPNQSKK